MDEETSPERRGDLPGVTVQSSKGWDAHSGLLTSSARLLRYAQVLHLCQCLGDTADVICSTRGLEKKDRATPPGPVSKISQVQTISSDTWQIGEDSLP